MACEIIFKDNKKVGVKAPNGETSLLFQKILQIPHIENFDQALQAYTNVLVETQEEPNLSFSGFSTLSEALKASKPNSQIEVSAQGFRPFMTIDATINPQTRVGLINSLIKEDLLTGKSFLDVDGAKIMEVTGNNEQEKAINSDVARTVSERYKGALSATVGQDFNIQFRERQEMPKGRTLQSLTQEFDEPTAVFIKTLEEITLATNSNNSELEELNILPENELQEKLLNLLNKLGVKTTSIDKWAEKYQQKNGYEASAKALADLSNNIVAFKDGVITQEELLEEVSHFIIATLPQEEIANQKRNVHRTQEWTDYAEQYFEIYGETLQGEELEDAVREEILGKVLANSLKDNFARENQPTLEGGIVATLRDFFQNFFNRVFDFFQPSYQNDLETFTAQVYRDLMNDSLNVDIRNKENKRYVLYSVGNISALSTVLQKQYETLLNQQYALANSPSNKNTLNRLKETIQKADEVSLKNSAMQLVGVANSQVNALSRALESADKSSRHFTPQENGVYQSMVSRVEPMLAQVREMIDDKAIQSQVTQVLEKLSTIKGRVPATNQKARDLIVERVIRKNNMTNEQAQKYREYIDNISKRVEYDTGWLHAHLGGLINARDGLLNLAGDIIERTVYQERTTHQNQTKPFINALEAIGLSESNIPKTLKKLLYNGSIINEKDPAKVLKVDQEDKARILSEVLGEEISPETVEQKLEELNKQLIELNTQTTEDPTNIEKQAQRDKLQTQLNDFDRLFRQTVTQRFNSYFDPEYLERLNKFSLNIGGIKIDRNSIPQSVLDLDKMYRAQIGEIRKMGELTSSDIAEIKNITKQKINESNPRYADGRLKRGVLENYDRNLKKFYYTFDESVINTISSEDSFEAQKVIGLQNLMLLNSEFYKGEGREDGIPQKFLDALEDFPTEQEKLDFLYNNANISFPQEFWENFDPNQSLVARLLDLNTPEASVFAEQIREQQAIISSILRGNKNLNNPSEVDVFDMSEVETASIREAQSILETKTAEARNLLEETETVENEAVSTTNEAYRKDLQSNGIEANTRQEIDFIQKHVTPNGRASIDNLRRNLERIKNGQSVIMTDFLNNLIGERTDYDNILSEYARRKLLPYYKRTEPQGFTEALQNLRERVAQNEKGAVLDYVNSGTIQVRPSWSYYDSMANVNPKWLENRDAQKDQYTEEYLRKVRNDEYYTRYGIGEDGVATKNLQEYQARQILLEYHEQSLENYGIPTSHDRYQIPQFLRSAVRRLTDGSNKLKSLKEIASDMTGIREDEADLGQDIAGNLAKKGDSNLTVPMYGVRKLKDQEDVTDELLLSYTMFNQQSALYKARRENISDMLVLEDFILSRDYVGKKAEATHTYKMFNSFLKANFYGVKESFSQEVSVLGKKVDLGKLARTFNNWVRFSNLAGITVPLTSAFQGKVQEILETMVGEVLDPIAYAEANKEFRRKASKAAGEVIKFNGKSELNVYGERFGLYNLTERFENSYMGKGVRAGLKSSSLLHSLGNFPVTTTSMLSVLFDYRFYGNEVVTFKQYKEINPAGTKEEWKKLEFFKDSIPVKDGTIQPDYKGISEKLGLSEEETASRVDLIMEGISNRVASAVQRIDSAIPAQQKSLASRDSRAAFLLLHTNWFWLGIQYKTKNRHYNISEQSFQEGNWRSAYNLINNVLRNVAKPKEIKKIWDENLADPVTRRNLRRTVAELGVANALALVAILLANMADSDEDPAYLLTMAEYFSQRVAVEQISSTLALPLQVQEMSSDPLIAKRKLEDLLNIDLFSIDVIEQGSFSGDTRQYRWFSKNLPFIKDYNRFRDFRGATDTYAFFNLNDRNKNIFNWTWADNLAVEEDK